MFRGLFINLERDLARRQRMEAEIGRFNLSQHYERLEAVEAESGWIGCFQSHIDAITEARLIGGVVHIVEDDVILSGAVAGFLDSPFLDGLLHENDLVFLSMWVDPKEQSLRRYQDAFNQAGAGFSVMNLRGMRIGSADSYVVSPRSIERLHWSLLSEARRGPGVALDTFFSRLVQSGELTASVVVPFLTCVDLESGVQSSIQTIPQDDQRRYIMLRTGFFVDRSRQPWFEWHVDAGPSASGVEAP